MHKKYNSARCLSVNYILSLLCMILAIIDIILWCIYPNIINTYRYKNNKYEFKYAEPYNIHDISIDEAIGK